MNNNFRDILEAIKQKLESVHNKFLAGLGWLLIILCGLVIIAFLYRCFKTVLGRDTLSVSDWLGFLVSMGLLTVGILSVSNRGRSDQDDDIR